MSRSPLVSIVIPVFNGANYMRQAIESALSQSYRNIEVIVVNDGSDDRGETERIAASYGDGIRYYRKENGGVSTALNLGIEQMRGEWFAWLSHDDLFSPNRIESDMALAEKYPEVKIFFCKIRMIDHLGLSIEDIPYPLNKVTTPRDALILRGVDFCTMTVHRSCFDCVGMFNESNLITQDVEMSLKLSKSFVFVLNDFTETLKREHPERGTHLHELQRNKDIRRLCEFIHREFTIFDFFPHLRGNGEDLKAAWTWLGNFYKGFSAIDYAEECYLKAGSCAP